MKLITTLLMLLALPMLLGLDAKAYQCKPPVYDGMTPECIYIEGEDGQLCWCGLEDENTLYCACDDPDTITDVDLAAWLDYRMRHEAGTVYRGQ